MYALLLRNKAIAIYKIAKSWKNKTQASTSPFSTYLKQDKAEQQHIEYRQAKHTAPQGWMGTSERAIGKRQHWDYQKEEHRSLYANLKIGLYANRFISVSE